MKNARNLGRVFRGTVICGLVAVGCGAGASAGDAEGVPQADSWDPNTESPSSILPGASVTLADLAGEEDVGKEFGVDDDHVPYPDTYWPFVNEGVDAKWNGNNPSPLEKALTVNDPQNLAKGKAWEHKNHGSATPGVADWWGHCPGWTGAAMFNKPILHAVEVKSDGAGGVTSCAAGDSGCTRFEIGDINALEAEIFVDGDSSFLGARCDTKPADIKRDKYGRIARDGSGCHGLNAGSLLVVLGNRMKRDHQPIAIDAQTAFNTDQIWNQPAYRYTLNAFEKLTKKDAIAKVAGNATPVPRSYVWNKDAKGFVLVDIGLKWVREHGPNLEMFSGKDSTRIMRMLAVIELDKEPSDPSAHVIGGEFLDDPEIGADRLTVPPFVWIAEGPGNESLNPLVGGGSHNPYLKPSFVQKLVELGSARE